MKQISTKARISFHRISAAALSPVGFRLALAALLLAAAAAFGGFHFIAVAQAQDTDGAITGLTLGSDSPGTLTVSWDTPSPAPTDYRIDWAKSGESYQSYKVDEGHVYPEGSVTTVTITDLEAGAEYKVRMRARYNQGEHANSPWSGPWAEARLAVAAEPTPTPEPTSEPTATPEDGAIGSPTATGDNAGRLVIAWQAPQAPHDAPTDYRVNWTRSDEDYPAHTEEHGNVYPATPTHTLEGLDHDTEYKIRIRARYSPNDQYDAHWSGPWTEITARVVSSPRSAPAAPSLIGTAVTPEGHVTLLWLDPSDDSITGYRVVRGPDAESLEVIEEDTGSSAVSYTDTEAEAGQTHAYAVQARSAAGLSPMSNTRTATVPQNEEEEEPVPQRQQHESSDTTLSALTVSPTDIIGFAADRTSYEVGVASTVTRATVAGTANHSAASVAYSPADADTTTTVHDVDLSAGRNVVTVTVTAEDGSTTETYTVSVNRGVTDEFGWKAVDDLDGLTTAGNGLSRGIWSDGTTMWVADRIDSKIYAYSADGAHDASKDFNTLNGASNNRPTGIWSDGTTMWVADSQDDKLYAYNLNTKARDASKDFTTLSGAGNRDPWGIWSNDDTMWVADWVDDKLYAYNLNTKARDASKDFNAVFNTGSDFHRGIWSDGDTMWVADAFYSKLYAYNLNTKARDASQDFNALDAASNVSATGIWSDGATMWVGDSGTDKVYSYNMPLPPSTDATLSALTVSPEDIIGFAPDRTTYPYQVGVASTETRATITATANHPGASVTYSGTDADTSTTIHDVDLTAGRNAVTVTVTAEDGSATETYTVSVNRGVTGDYGWKAALDLDGLIAAGNDNAFGIWSDGTTMWVADFADDKIYAYHTDGTRDSSRDFNTLSGASNNQPVGIWSDGATMWVADLVDEKLYAYRMSDKERDASKDFNMLSGAGNNNPYGIWSDGATMWVADEADSKVYAYNLNTKARDASKEFSTSRTDIAIANPAGIWSDGTTMWVANPFHQKLYAYRMSNKARDASKDFNTLAGAGNHDPTGIWSDGETVWVVDAQVSNDKVYSYNMPPSGDATLSALTVSPEDIIGFAAGRTSYEVGVASTVSRATVAAIANHPAASVAYSPADADTSTTIHDIDLSAGRNAVTITVTAQDGSTTRDHTVSVNRGVADDYGWKAMDDLDGLIAAGNNNPFGIWSDGTTMWVADTFDDKLYAYNTDGTRDGSRDFNTLAAASNGSARGIWSDGATMWVADSDNDKLYAYNTDGTRDSARDFNTLSGASNNYPTGIWSDGDTMWVADLLDSKIYAYRMSDKEPRQRQGLQHAQRGGQPRPHRHLVRRHDHVGGRLCGRQDIRLPDVRQGARQRQGLQHARRGRQHHPVRHLVRQHDHVGGRQ